MFNNPARNTTWYDVFNAFSIRSDGLIAFYMSDSFKWNFSKRVPGDIDSKLKVLDAITTVAYKL